MAFFEAVRSGVAKITAPGQLSLKDINERINELLKASIHSEGVISLFADTPGFSIFDPHYLKIPQLIKGIIDISRRLLRLSSTTCRRSYKRALR